MSQWTQQSAWALAPLESGVPSSSMVSPVTANGVASSSMAAPSSVTAVGVAVPPGVVSGVVPSGVPPPGLSPPPGGVTGAAVMVSVPSTTRSV